MVGSSCRAPEAAGENEQCERLTEFQARTFAAFLLGAEQLPADAVDPEIVPHWLSRADEACYAGGEETVSLTLSASRQGREGSA